MKCDVDDEAGPKRPLRDDDEPCARATLQRVRYESADVQRRVEELERALGRQLPRGAIVLEVGAGTGELSLALALAGHFRDVIASDANVESLAQVGLAAVAHGVRVRLLLTDGRRLPLPDASIDLVVGRVVQDQERDREALLDEVRRVLKPGGACVFAKDP